MGSEKENAAGSIHSLPDRYATASGIMVVIEYISQHLDQDITLSDLAGVVNLSPCHFARMFKRLMGITPHQYLIQYRVKQARVLLEKGAMTVGEVAQRVGFADHSHLTRHFKRVFGFPPKAICQRKNILEYAQNVQDKQK